MKYFLISVFFSFTMHCMAQTKLAPVPIKCSQECDSHLVILGLSNEYVNIYFSYATYKEFLLDQKSELSNAETAKMVDQRLDSMLSVITEKDTISLIDFDKEDDITKVMKFAMFKLIERGQSCIYATKDGEQQKSVMMFKTIFPQKVVKDFKLANKKQFLHVEEIKGGF